VPADTGGRIRMFHAARCVAKRHSVTLCTLYETEKQHSLLSDHRHLPVRILAVRHRASRLGSGLRSALRRTPLHVERFRSNDMWQVIAGEMERTQYDLIWCHLLYVAHNIPPASIPMVLDQQNLDHELWERVAKSSIGPFVRALGRFNARAWRRVEKAQWPRFRFILSVSPEEQAQTTRLVVPGTKVWLVPNGVSIGDPIPSRRDRVGRAVVLFCGSMQLLMNEDAALWLARDIWPVVRSAEPDVELHIVGGHPGPRIRRLNGQQGVVVTGWVEDVRPAYARSSVAVVPLRLGGGTKIKTLEALSLGMPVVTTSVGAQGLGLKDGEHALIADSVEAFAQAIVGLLRDPELGAKLGSRAREYVELRYSWDRLYGGAISAIERELGFGGVEQAR
jgi:glycosyltransferase involved in cell wall biosynthesis